MTRTRMCRRYNSESAGLRDSEEDVLLDDTHGGGRLPRFPPARLSQTPNSLGNVPTKGIFPRQRGLMAGNAMNAEPGNKALITRDGRSSVMSPMTRHARRGGPAPITWSSKVSSMQSGPTRGSCCGVAAGFRSEHPPVAAHRRGGDIKVTPKFRDGDSDLRRPISQARTMPCAHIAWGAAVSSGAAPQLPRSRSYPCNVRVSVSKSTKVGL
jgi:hypothetical protein